MIKRMKDYYPPPDYKRPDKPTPAPPPKRSERILNQVEEIRKSNNRNWMDLARLAFEVSPERARDIMSKITECDGQINELTKELGK